MSEYPPPGQIEVVPPELTAAAGPLHQAQDVLRGLADDRAGLERFCSGSPNPIVHRALQSYIETVELAVWQVGGEAGTLAHLLKLAAQEYTAAEREQQRRFAAEAQPPVGR